jgi:phospholipid/cholesterol/gamma-HCH transport system substrate-binding protein
MGAVEEIQIIQDFVRVTVKVDRVATLHDDAGFSLQTIGIVGEMVIEIDPGTGEPVAEGHVFTGKLAPSLPAMTGAATDALADLRGLTADIGEFLAEIRGEGRIGATLEAAHGSADNLGAVFRENRQDLRVLISNFRETSVALKEAMAGPDSNLARALAGASRTFTRADSVLTNLEKTSAILTSVVEQIQAGQGTAGRLLADDQLYIRADSTLTAVNELLEDVRRNPRKYFKFSFIDF